MDMNATMIDNETIARCPRYKLGDDPILWSGMNEQIP